MNRVNIGNRLRDCREKQDLSRVQVAPQVDIGTTTLQQWEAGTREASIETIGKLAKIYKVSPKYLIFGDEPNTSINTLPVSENRITYNAGHNDSPVIPTHTDNPDDDYALIPAFDIEVSAGHGMVCLGQAKATKHLAFRKRWMTARGLNVESLAALFTKGDSMTPTIPESAVVIINRDKTKALDGKVYVIRIADRHYVKRTQWLLDGGLRLISDNKLYDPLDITKADMTANNVEICGQVIHASYDLPN